jgi:hypothetical protein
MKTSILPFVIILTSCLLHTASAQNSPKVDSLLAELKASEADINRAQILYTLAQAYIDERDFQKSLTHSSKALQLANRFNK